MTAEPEDLPGHDVVLAPPATGLPATGLPAVVRARLAALASERLDGLPPEQVPAGLRPFARFAPARRVRLAAVPLAAALDVDAVFRQRVAEALREGLPELAAGVDEGRALPGVAPDDVAAATYLLRPEGWQARVGAVCLALADAQVTAPPTAELERLRQELAGARDAADGERDRLRQQLAEARAEVTALRKRLREVGDRAGRAEAAARTAVARQEQDRLALAAERARGELLVREALARAAAAEQAIAAGRQAAREGRAADEVRLRVLLDALLGAAQGLRRELALPPTQSRPADALETEYAPVATGPVEHQGRDREDPALLDALLQVPLVHLLVDGYNVTKAGYGELTLESQRGRLLAGLGALAARTGAEVTVVFDGAERVTSAALPSPRRVRLLFSREGETADEVLRRLVRHEPPGRPVVVVSSDREVAEGVRASGARDVPSRALLRLLARS